MNADPCTQLAQALTQLIDRQAVGTHPFQVVTARYVTIGLAAAKTGLTDKAIRRKIEDGIWRESIEWRHAPDGHVMIDIDAIERWVESRGTHGAGRRHAAPRRAMRTGSPPPTRAPLLRTEPAPPLPPGEPPAHLASVQSQV